MEQVRNQATAEARAHFNTELTAVQLDNSAKTMGFDLRSGTKEEVAEAYRVQYIFQRLVLCRQSVMRTKDRSEAANVYLPWYRVLLAFFRRSHYLSLRQEEDKDE
jgi:hypothetical protein